MELMTNEEMIKYLKDYSDIVDLQKNCTNLPIKTIFTLHMMLQNRKEDITKEYYDTMRRVYGMYCYLKLITYNDENKKEKDSNKVISKVIRDGMNNKDCFKVSKDAKSFIIFSKEDKNINVKVNMDHLNKVVEIKRQKRPALLDQILFVSALQKNSELSYDDTLHMIERVIMKEIIPVSYTSEDVNTYNLLRKAGITYCTELYNNMTSPDFLTNYSNIMYIDSVLTQSCTDETININNKSYNTKELKESLIQGRWFISNDKKLVLYDTEKLNEKENKLKFVGKLDIKEFSNWADNYMNKNNLSKTNNKVKKL